MMKVIAIHVGTYFQCIDAGNSFSAMTTLRLSWSKTFRRLEVVMLLIYQSASLHLSCGHTLDGRWARPSLIGRPYSSLGMFLPCCTSVVVMSFKSDELIILGLFWKGIFSDYIIPPYLMPSCLLHALTPSSELCAMYINFHSFIRNV